MLNLNLLDGPCRRCFLLFVCVLGLIAFGKPVVADENNRESAEAASVKRKTHHPHCGLYCIYTAMKLAGPKPDFRELVKPEYLSSRKGSSLANLKKAAKDNGLYAESVTKLTSRALRESPHPVILHVKFDVTSREYNHYELLLGAENGKAKLFNPPEPVRLVSFQELAPRWDGNGLIVSAKPIDLGAIFAPARKRLATYAAIVVAIILSVRWAKRWLPETMLNSRRTILGLSTVQSAGFAIAALLCGMIYHFVNNDEGFLANANATASIQQAHLGNFIPKVSEKQIKHLLNTDTVFIDARFARDFEKDHLKGAINVPVDANDVKRKKAMADIAKDARIVVYCQSAGCRFGESVAIKLISDGFCNVSLFKGGWQEWAAKKEENDKLREKPS